jgi:hypothetical protein
LYGLKSSGAAWRAHLAATMEELMFTSCFVDPDVWLRPFQNEGGLKFYEYVLIYTDDFLCISHDLKSILDTIGKHFKLKPELIKTPETYLGANLGHFSLPDKPDKPRWSMSSTNYVKQAVANVEKDLSEIKRDLPNKVSLPMSTKYRPELDVSPVLNAECANYFHSQIGVLRWAVEIGRINIMCEVSMLSSFLAMPREGHLSAVLHIFAYLKSHNRSRLVFDDSYADIENHFIDGADWTDFYGNVKEPIPPNAPKPRGRAVEITAFVDADHAGDKVTRRSRTGVLIYLSRAPIMWFSKRQNSVETSSFGSEFVALKIATEMIQGLRYKLRMMGIPIDGPARVLCDNMSVVHNTTAPESMLKKKSNAIAYHFVQENVAMGVIKIAYEPSETNLANALTKVQSAPVRQNLMRQILY